MRFVKRLLILVFGALPFSAAAEGEVRRLSVTIEYGDLGYGDGKVHGVFQGSLFAARDSYPGPYLYCREKVAGGVDCGAREPGGVEVSCTTSSPSQALLKNVRAINDASWVAVYFDPSTNPPTCTDIRLAKGSPFLSDLRSPDIRHLAVEAGGDYMFAVISNARFNEGNELFYCQISSWGFGRIDCAARNRNGTFAQCHTYESENPAAAEAVRAIDSASMVDVEIWRPGTCTTIRVSKGSPWAR
jgi:hypothetical protein